MKTTNTPYGYDSAPCMVPVPWYYWPQFPVLPIFDYRPADKWNTSSWGFSWLFVRYWSMDHIQFQFEIGIDTMCLGGSAFRVGFILPYTRLIFSIPLPLGWLYKFRRKPPFELQEL